MVPGFFFVLKDSSIFLQYNFLMKCPRKRLRTECRDKFNCRKLTLLKLPIWIHSCVLARSIPITLHPIFYCIENKPSACTLIISDIRKSRPSGLQFHIFWTNAEMAIVSPITQYHVHRGRVAAAIIFALGLKSIPGGRVYLPSPGAVPCALLPHFILFLGHLRSHNSIRQRRLSQQNENYAINFCRVY